MSESELGRLRDETAAIDARILELVNRRLGLVRQIREHKRANGIEFLDPAQEERLLARLRELNGGPLAGEGVDHLFREILALVKRELNPG